MAGDSGDTINKSPHLGPKSFRVSRQEIHGQKYLQEIGEKDHATDFRPEHSYDVRSAEIAGAVFSQIDAAKLSGKIRRRNRAGEIREYDADYRRHLCRLSTHDDAEGIAAESPRFAKAVVQIANVVLLYEVGIVSKDGDHWRCRLDLGGVVQLDLSSGGLRGLASPNDLGQRGIHLRSADPLVALRIHFQQQLEDLGHSLSAQGRSKHERDELEEWSFLPCLFLESGRRVVLLLLQVPLVDDDYESATALPRQRRDLEILIVKPLGGIEHENADIRPLD